MQNLWWSIFPYLGIPIHLNMHVVLGTDPHPDASTKNELIFTYQEDHIFWVESVLALNPILTLGLGPLCLKYLRPVAGQTVHACMQCCCQVGLCMITVHACMTCCDPVGLCMITVFHQ